MGQIHKRKRRSRPPEAGKPEATRGDLITRILIIGLAVSMGIWALFATLIALHAHRTTKYARVDLEDMKEAQREIKMEHRADMEAVLKDLREAEMLREQVSQLVEMLVVQSKPPRRFEDVLDRVQKVHNQLTMTSLDAADLKYTKDLLVSLLRNVPLPQATSEGGPQVRKVLELLAEAGAIEAKDIDRLLSEVNAGLEGKPKKPSVQVVEVVMREPDVKPKPPVVVPEPEPVPEGPQPQPYINKELNFRVLLPPEWVVKDKQVSNGVMAVSPRKDFRQIDTGYAVISATKLKDAAETLTSYTRTDFQRVEEYADQYELLEEGEMQLSKSRVPARYIRYKHSKLAKHWESVKIIGVHEDVAYMMGFHALSADYQDKYAENFARIVASFKLLK